MSDRDFVLDASRATSVGYGLAAGGVVLNALLASCALGLTLVNIDNGYGGANAALRHLNSFADAGGRTRASVSMKNRGGVERCTAEISSNIRRQPP